MDMPKRQPRQSTPEIPLVSPEIPYLIEDVQDLVTRNAEHLLADHPYQFVIEDFMPDASLDHEIPLLPRGISTLERKYLTPYGLHGTDFIGMDIRHIFPIESPSDNPLHVTVKWANGSQIVLAQTSELPILLVEARQGATTLEAHELSNRQSQEYFDNIGLPESLHGASFEEYFKDISHASKVRLTRQSDIQAVDLMNEVFIEHDAVMMKDIDGTSQLVQELKVSIDHLTDAQTDGLYFPPSPHFRTMLRFTRNQRENAWLYQGTYTGKLANGEFVDTLEQQNPKLGIPTSKVIDKALNALDIRAN